MQERDGRESEARKARGFGSLKDSRGERCAEWVRGEGQEERGWRRRAVTGRRETGNTRVTRLAL